MKRAFEALLRDGSTANVDAPMISLPEMHTLMGFEDVWAFERRWAAPYLSARGRGGTAIGNGPSPCPPPPKAEGERRRDPEGRGEVGDSRSALH